MTQTIHAPSGPDVRTTPLTYRTSGMAAASLACAVLFIGGLGSILAIVFGFAARDEIDLNTPGTVGGRGMATAGIVLGLVQLAVLAVLVGLFIGGMVRLR